jgi:hypothetical protein
MWPDLKIARNKLVNYLSDGEMYLADGGYSDGGQYAVTPSGYNTLSEYKKKVARARHEAINGKFKTFGVLESIYRHGVRSHGTCFRVIAILTQMMIENEPKSVFQVHYKEH